MLPRKSRLLKVIAPIMEAQLVETAILNILNHQMSDRHQDFPRSASPLRETESWNSAFAVPRDRMPVLYGARAAMIGGCVGTSNVLAGQLFDVPVQGTHAHSWIMSFPDEYTAFQSLCRPLSECLHPAG